MDSFKTTLMKDEGFRTAVYDDHLGIPTIGYGTKISEIRVSKEVAEQWLDEELDEKEERLRSMIPAYNGLNIARKNVIRSMAYQMGTTGVLRFKNMWRAIRSHDWWVAAIEMRNSQWWRDPATKARAERMAVRMESGVW